MKKKFLLVLLPACCLMATSFANVASAADSSDQGNYIMVSRATGEIDKYELTLDDSVSVPVSDTVISSSDQFFAAPATRASAMPQGVQSNDNFFLNSNASSNGIQGITAASISSEPFNWTIPVNITTRSNTKISLNAGDTISFLFATNTDYDLDIGCWDNNTGQFHVAWYYGGYGSTSISNSFTVAQSCNVSFAIANIGITSINCNGSYTHP